MHTDGEAVIQPKVTTGSRGLRWLGFAFLLLLADQITKHFTSTALAYGESVPITAFFNWVHHHNTGAAFSFLADAGGWQRPFLIALAAGVSVALVYWLWQAPRLLPYRLGLSAILGGALSNLVDRVWLGYVVDYLDLHYGHLHWPAFNLADVGITVGALLLINAEVGRAK